MQIRLNGEDRKLEQEFTISGLIEHLGIPGKNLAVEHNGEFLDPETFDARAVRDGDTLEIVRFVGGG